MHRFYVNSSGCYGKNELVEDGRIKHKTCHRQSTRLSNLVEKKSTSLSISTTAILLTLLLSIVLRSHIVRNGSLEVIFPGRRLYRSRDRRNVHTITHRYSYAWYNNSFLLANVLLARSSIVGLQQHVSLQNDTVYMQWTKQLRHIIVVVEFSEQFALE